MTRVDDITVHDYAVLSEHAAKVIGVMDDDFTRGDILAVLAVTVASVLLSLSKTEEQLRTAPTMFAAMVTEILQATS